MIYTILFNFFNVVATIAILAYFFKHYNDVNKYFNYGIFVACTYTVIQLLRIIIPGNNIRVYFVPGSTSVLYFLTATLGLIFSFIKVYIYTCTGIYLCSFLGLKGVPIVGKMLKNSSEEEIKVKEYIIGTASVIVASAIFSMILFRLTFPHATLELKPIAEIQLFWNFSIIQRINTIITILAIVISEELLFRFVVPNLTAKLFNFQGKKYWIAIVISSIFWTIGYANSIYPTWVKFVQIFPIGIALGGIYKRFGLESCIIAHLIFNIVMVFIGEGLILI